MLLGRIEVVFDSTVFNVNGGPEKSYFRIAIKSFNHDTPSIPLPAGLPLVLTGLASLALLRRKRT